MMRKAIAGLCIAAWLGGCAGLPTIDVSSVNTTGVNTTTQVSTAPIPPVARDKHANWSDYGETPAGAVTVGSVDNGIDFLAAETAADLATQAQLSHQAGEALPEEGSISKAMMIEGLDTDVEHENWSDFGESPPDANR